MIKDLIKLSNHLDAKGLRKESDYLDALVKSAVTVTQLQKDISTNKSLIDELAEKISAIEINLFGPPKESQ